MLVHQCKHVRAVSCTGDGGLEPHSTNSAETNSRNVLLVTSNVSHVWSVMLRTRVRSSPPQRCKRSAPAELSCWPSDPAAQVQLAAHQQRMDERILCHVSLGPRNLSEHLYEQLLEALSERLSEHCRSIVGVLSECCRSDVEGMSEQCARHCRRQCSSMSPAF